MRRAVFLALVILASCGGNGDSTTTIQPPPLTTLPAATVPPTTAAPSTTAAGTTVSTTTTTTTLPPNAAAALALSQVVFGETAFAVITNFGNDTGNLDGMWLVRDSSTQPLPYVTLDPGEQALLGLGAQPPPELAGMAAAVPFGPTLGSIEMAGGELALYRDDSFDDPESLIGYVAWGADSHPTLERAVEYGVWEGPAVQIIDEAPSISTGIYPAIRAEDWAVDLGG